MKDKQVSSGGGEAGLFLVSVCLHCVSLTVLVYLRHSFGFAFLRPKSFLLACAWAFGLFAVYAWIDGAAWQEYRALLWFGLGTVALYGFHLLATLRRKWGGRAEHDRLGGLSNLGRLPSLGKTTFRTAVGGEAFRRWGEPVLVLTVAGLLRTVLGERHLWRWLMLAGFCLWAKEALNQWLRLQQRKHRQDMLADAEDAFEEPPAAMPPSQQVVNFPARKGKIHRLRTPSKP